MRVTGDSLSSSIRRLVCLAAALGVFPLAVSGQQPAIDYTAWGQKLCSGCRSICASTPATLLE